jgi:hypothetical protein
MTEQLTYDPVVGARSRLGAVAAPPRTPPPGRALVLVPDHGPPLTVLPGEPVPDGGPGGFRGVFQVDTTEHRLVLPVQLPGRQADFLFHCGVVLLCRVADPAQVVARGIRDIGSTVYGPVRDLLRPVARDYGAGQFREAEAALNAALRGFTGDGVVVLRDARAEVSAGATPGTRLPRVLRGEVVGRRTEPPHHPPDPGRVPEQGRVPGRRDSRVRGAATGGPAGRGGAGRPAEGGDQGSAEQVSRVRGPRPGDGERS